MDKPQAKELIAQTMEALANADDNLHINHMVEELITRITGAEYASIWMNEYPYLVRERKEGVRKLSLEEKRGLLYQCFLTQKSAFYNYITSEKGYVPEIDNPDSIRIKSKITIPLIVGEHLIGIVTCYSSVRKIKNFSPADFEKFKAITPIVIDAIVKMQANRGREILPDDSNGHRSEPSLLRQESRIVHQIETAERDEAKDSPEEAGDCLKETATIVHDIRTPANNLLGFLEILEEHIHEPRLNEYLEHAKKSAQLINELTSSILKVAASRHRREGLRLTSVPATGFFADIAEIFSARAYEKRIAYDIFIDPCLPKEIEVDSMKLKRVLINLLGNAVKFTPTRGSIQLSIRYNSQESRLGVVIRDSGIGIPMEKQKEIFEAFTQADETTAERFGGTGLGLSITSDYLREMGSELRLQSEPEKGSTFSFELPVKAPDETPRTGSLAAGTYHVTILMDPADKATARNIGRYLLAMGLESHQIQAVSRQEKIPAETTHLILFQSRFDPDLLLKFSREKLPVIVVEEEFLSIREPLPGQATLISRYGYYGEALYTFLSPREPLKILIVEDDRISVDLIRSMLEEEYCRVDTAYNGLDGLDKLIEAAGSGHPYRLVFSDQNMPRLSGKEMLRQYRHATSGMKIPHSFFVSISGDPTEKEREDLFDFYAAKPFRKSEILSIVQKVQHQTQNKE
ncbi:hybrid sensor histidine kinase/response regulator [Nitratifractor sp.]